MIRICLSITAALLFAAVAAASAQISVYASSTYKPDPHDTHGETCPTESGECSYAASTSVDSYTTVGGSVTQVNLHVDSGIYYDINTNQTIANFATNASTLSLKAFTIPGYLVGQAGNINVKADTHAYNGSTKIITVTSASFVP